MQNTKAREYAAAHERAVGKYLAGSHYTHISDHPAANTAICGWNTNNALETIQDHNYEIEDYAPECIDCADEEADREIEREIAKRERYGN